MVNIPRFTVFFTSQVVSQISESHHSKICHLLTNCHVREDQPAKPGEIRQGSKQAALVQAFFWCGGGCGGRMMIPRHPVISPDEGMSGLPNTYMTVAKTMLKHVGDVIVPWREILGKWSYNS